MRYPSSDGKAPPYNACVDALTRESLISTVRAALATVATHPSLTNTRNFILKRLENEIENLSYAERTQVLKVISNIQIVPMARINEINGSNFVLASLQTNENGIPEAIYFSTELADHLSAPLWFGHEILHLIDVVKAGPNRPSTFFLEKRAADFEFDILGQLQTDASFSSINENSRQSLNQIGQASGSPAAITDFFKQNPQRFGDVILYIKSKLARSGSRKLYTGIMLSQYTPSILREWILPIGIGLGSGVVFWELLHLIK